MERRPASPQASTKEAAQRAASLNYRLQTTGYPLPAYTAFIASVGVGSSRMPGPIVVVMVIVRMKWPPHRATTHSSA
jgi:hypothetical protein